jgi:long-chain acyl-CoA synthetase
MPNLSLNLSEAATMYPDHAAIRMDDAVLTYREVDDAVARLAALLQADGLEPGDRVGVMLPNVPHFAIAYYAVLRAGGIVVPMNPLLKAREIEYYLRDSGARELIVWHEAAGEAAHGAKAAGVSLRVVAPEPFRELLAAAAPAAGTVARAAGDTAVILYTSGTTGRPKGAELSHGNLRRNAAVFASTLLHLGPDDVIVGCLPFFHAFGQTCCLNAAFASGSTVTVIPRFDAGATLAAIAEERATVFAGVPTMYSALLEQARHDTVDASSLRVCVSGGAALPVEVLRSFEERFGCVILEGYGLSETSPVASFNHPDRERRPGSIGTPIDGVEFRLIDDDGKDADDVGEIVIRGHNIMKGYWQRPQDTEAAFVDGWFRTGDIGRVDEDGYYYIVDRKKDLIIRGGYNVYPREVEEVLYEHPAVREAAVVGVPHQSLGEEIGAAVVLAGGASATPEELRDFVKRRIAAYKYPRQVWLVDELPKGPTGKILRREVVPPPPPSTPLGQPS